MSEQIELIEIEKIKPDPTQPRIEFDEKKIQELASTYKTQGMIHTIEIDENNTIILGERRWRAAKLIDLEKVKATRKTGLDKATRLERQLIDDANRKDLSDMERAWAYATGIININLKAQGKDERYTIPQVKEMKNENLVNLIGLSVGGRGHSSGASELSRRIGVSQVTISNYLQLLKLSDLFQKGIEKGFVVGEKEVKDEETGEIEIKDDIQKIPKTYGEIIARVKDDKLRGKLEGVVLKDAQIPKKEREKRVFKTHDDLDEVVSFIEKPTVPSPIEEKKDVEVPLTTKEKTDLVEGRKTVDEVKMKKQWDVTDEVIKEKIESMPAEEKKEIEEIKQRMIESRVETQRILNDPKTKERGKWFTNWLVLGNMVNLVEAAFCPKCGKTQTIKFACCDLDILAAIDLTQKKLDELPKADREVK